jgi:hypothetical protein
LCDGIGDDDEDICWIWRAILPLSSPSSELDDLYSRDVGDGLPLCRGGGILPFRNAFDEDDRQTVAMILQVGMVVFISVFGLLLLSMNTNWWETSGVESVLLHGMVYSSAKDSGL